MSSSKPERRRYHSPLRRERAAHTRERIVTAGAEILHGFPIWNWRALTVRAVAERAGVAERTVYRHFASERELRDAVMDRVEQEVGIDLAGVDLGDLQEVTRQIYKYVSARPFERRADADPATAEANARQREALLGALAPHTDGWSDADHAIAAAMLDVLWNYASYEHLVANWQLDSEEAVRGITWVIGLLQDAIRADRRPGS